MKLGLQSLGAFFVGVTLIGCGGEEPTAEGEIRLAPVQALTVKEASSYPLEEQFVGMVEARRRSGLAFELSGIVDHVAFDEGDEVAAGDLLAEIDTSRLEARRDELAAALEEAEATRDLNDGILERFRGLVSRGGVSVQEVEEARERAVASRARVAQTEAQLKSVEVDLNKSRLTAPYAGKVSRREVDEGAVVNPNQVVLELLETGDLEIRVAMTSEAVADLTPGAELPVVGPLGSVSTLKVARILPGRDLQTRTVDVILSVEAGVTALRDGDLVRALRTESVETDGFFLPRDALTESIRGLWACYAVVPVNDAGEGAHRLDRRDLEVIHEYADVVYVRGALEDGDRILANGLQKVAPGQRVMVMDSEEHPPFPGDLTTNRIPK